MGIQQNRWRQQHRSDPVTQGIQSLVLPAGQWAQERVQATGNFFSGIQGGGAIKAQLDHLREVNAGLLLYAAREEALNDRIKSLEGMLQTKSTISQDKLLARIIDYHLYEDRCTLNVGSNQGVKAGQGVLTSEGLLGVVQTLSNDRCQVLLVSSSSCRLGARVNTVPPVVGLIKGEGPSRLMFETNIAERTLVAGQKVVTNGLSDTLPPGLLIGYVQQSEKSAEFGASRASVIPVANLATAREVWVLR